LKTTYNDALDDAAILSGSCQLYLTLSALSLFKLGSLLQSAAGDVPVVNANDGNGPLFVCISAVLLASTSPQIAELAPASEGPVGKSVFLDIRR